MQSISGILQKSNDLSEHQVENAKEAAKAYTNLNTSIMDASKKLAKGNITQSEFNDLVKESFKSFDSLVEKIDESTESGKALVQTFKDARAAAEGFEKAAEKSEKQLNAMSTAMGQFSGVPMMNEFGGVLEKATQGGKGLTMALFTLGAAAGALAYDLGLVGDKLGTIAKYDKKLVGLNEQIDTIKENIKGGFASEQALGKFGFELQRMSVEFQKASKTALFGKGLGSVGYGAAELQLAGISAETIAESMTAASNASGKMPTAKIGADMSIFAKRTGQSSENIAETNDLFQRLNKVSEKTALNMQEGVRAMASKAGVSLGAAMTEISNASRDALSYQIKSASALAKQVIFAKSMGVSFNDIAKAGQSMVLNYKDSIKAEMQLSSMLGEQVDLSEVRAKFAAGDTSGALDALKAQGLNPEDMDMFQQQALQQATGMDLNTLQKVATRTGTTGGNLGLGNAAAGNAGYLSSVKSAEAASQVANAQISVAEAKFDIKISAKMESAINDAIMQNTDGLKTLMNQVNQTNAQKNAEVAMGAGTAGLIGGGLTATAGYLGKKLLGKGGATATAEGEGGIMNSLANGLGGTGKVTMGAAAKSGGAILGGITAAGVEGYKEWEDNKAKGIGTGENVARTAQVAGGAGLGAWGGAAAGAAIGSVVPVVGTLIGGLIGGALGAWGGSEIGKAAGNAEFGNKDAKAAAATAAAAPSATPGGTSVAAGDANKLLDKIAFSTNETVKGNNKLFDTTNKAIINGNSQIGQFDKIILNQNTEIAEIRTLNTNTMALVQLNANLQTLIQAGFFGTAGENKLSLYIDGKSVNQSLKRYDSNTKGQKKE
jgi:hypothetical protein